MKKSAAITILVALVAMCATVIVMRFQLTKANTPHEQYISCGRYYINGTVITENGNKLEYTTETISEKPAYDNEPIYIVFDDNGTENNTKDDVILGVIKDINTAACDTLENELSNDFKLERNGNNINITAHN